MTKPCAVPECPALAVERQETCQQHEYARIAKPLTCAVGSSCDLCHRKIKADDWVWAEPRKYQNRQKEWRMAYKHVACEPAAERVTRQQLREPPKPLLEAVDDAELDRGAA